MSAPVIRATFRCTNIAHAVTGNADNSVATVTLFQLWTAQYLSRIFMGASVKAFVL